MTEQSDNDNKIVPPAPMLEPLTSQLFLCELCSGPLQVVRVARVREIITIDQQTGQLTWVSELHTNEDAFSFEIQDASVRCFDCRKESSRIGYDWQRARLAINCCVCRESFFLEEGEAILEDAQCLPRPVCSRECRESFQCEP